LCFGRNQVIRLLFPGNNTVRERLNTAEPIDLGEHVSSALKAHVAVAQLTVGNEAVFAGLTSSIPIEAVVASSALPMASVQAWSQRLGAVWLGVRAVWLNCDSGLAAKPVRRQLAA
jgi:hypothetical protein